MARRSESGENRGRDREEPGLSHARTIALAVLAASLAPAAAGADVPRGRLALEFGLGPAEGGAPALLFGVGVGIVDSPTRRVDLRARYGILATQDASTGGEESTYNGTALLLELVHAWRAGRVEPWLSVGYAKLQADMDTVPVGSPTSTDTGASAAFGAGLRVATGERVLLSVEGLYVVPFDSELSWLSPRPQLGGASFLFGVTWRIGTTSVSAVEPVTVEPPADRPVAAGPGDAPAAPGEPSISEEAAPAPAASTTPAPAAVPGPIRTEEPKVLSCTGPSEHPSFAVHHVTGFLCMENPVAGGYDCTAHRIEDRFVNRAACEAACLRGALSCPAPRQAAGAACARCVTECGRDHWLPCSEANGAALEGASCRVEAGRWGLAETVAVSAQCQAPARE